MKKHYGRSKKVKASSAFGPLRLELTEDTPAGTMQIFIFPDDMIALIDRVHYRSAFAFILWVAGLYPGAGDARVYNDNDPGENILVGTGTTEKDLIRVFGKGEQH